MQNLKYKFFNNLKAYFPKEIDSLPSSFYLYLIKIFKYKKTTLFVKYFRYIFSIINYLEYLLKRTKNNILRSSKANENQYNQNKELFKLDEYENKLLTEFKKMVS